MFERKPIFRDRSEAGQRLGARLREHELKYPIVLALPRGGVPVGFEVAKALNAPLDILLVRKIGAPGHEELALGAVVEGSPPITVVNDGVSHELQHFISEESARQAREIERRRAAYRGGSPPPELPGRTAVVVYDGIATGATLRAALEAMKRTGAAKVIAAIPVAPDDSLPAVATLADEVVCLVTPEHFYAVGLHYETFGQTSDEEVVRLLDAAAGFGGCAV